MIAALPHCSGRVHRNRIVQVAHLATGKHLVMVFEVQPVRIVTQVEMDAPPTRDEQRALCEGLQ